MPRAGDVVDGKYRLVRELGKGGMGSVWEAEHVAIGARVAVKFLHPAYASDELAVRRFRREARAAGGIGHGAIVAVHDLGVAEDGSPFIVMESLRGETLGERIASAGPLEVPLAAFVGCQVLSGLAAAHAARIVHRDLKPENVFLVETGAALPGVKVLDFGISRIAGGKSDSAVTRITAVGSVLGTPFFMSPEQARGRDDVDGRADLYALGVILYEALTGTVPFDGERPEEVLRRIVSEPAPPPRSRRPDLPERLEAVILRALDKDRSRRHQSARELFDDLLPFVDEFAVASLGFPPAAPDAPRTEEVLAPPRRAAPAEPGPRETEAPTTRIPLEATTTDVRPPAGRRVLVAAAVAAVLVVGAATGLLLFRSRARPSRAPADLAVAVAAVEPARDAAPPGPAGPGVVPRVSVIAVLGQPEGARLFLDGAPVRGLPLRLDPDGPMRVLRVEAEGYRPAELLVDPSSDRAVRVELEPLAAEPDAAPGPAGPKVRPWRGKSRPGGRPDPGRPGYTAPYVRRGP